MADSERAKGGACFTNCRFGFLNFSQRDNFLGRQATLAVECGFGQLQPRTGGEILGACATQLRTGQLRERLAGADRIAGIREQSRDSCGGRSADFSVSPLIDGQLAQEHDKFSSGAGFNGARREAKIAQHAFVDLDRVGVLLVGVRFSSRWCRRGWFGGFLGAAATGDDRNAGDEDDTRFDSHRSIAALASSSIRASAASNRASRY